MSRFLQIVQWLLAIVILLILLISFAGLVIASVFYLFSSQRAVAFPQVTSSSNTQGPTLIITSTYTPFQPLPTSTVTPTPSITPTFTASPTQTPTNTPEPTFTFTMTPTITEVPLQESVSLVVNGHAQSFTLDCESRSAADLAGYFGIQIDEIDFLDHLPRSDDPDEGFVGNYWDALGQIPPNSYGVHAPPVATLLRSYGLNAYDKQGMTWDELKNELQASHPVMVWIIGNVVPGYPVSYTASNGHTTTVAAYEHTVIISGYDSSYVTVNDPDGALVYLRTINQFLESWSVLGNMAIVVVP
jgi:uncharacterized protein YvpB